jgi:8-oxo-dGTP diphosphatase
MRFTDYDTRLGAYAVIQDEQDRILLALWNERGDGLWTMIGGGVELYEGPEQAAVREAAEETGYVVELTQMLGIDAHVVEPQQRWADTDRPLKFVQVIYAARIVGGELRNEVDGSTSEARWFSLDEVAELSRSGIVDRALQLAGLVDDGPER